MDPLGKWVHYSVGNPFKADFYVASDIAEGPDGEVWVTTFDDGAWRFQDGQWTQFSPNTSDMPFFSLNTVTVAPDGSLWFGAYYDGAIRFDGQNWETFDTGDGLVNNNVNAIHFDRAGAIWFATSGGVSRYIP